MKPFQTHLEAFLHWEKTTPNQLFLHQPLEDNIKKYTYKQAGLEIRKIASAIKKYDLPKQSHIALLSLNCAHWIMSDIAIMMTGHVSIPIYPTLNSETVKIILTHSESKAIIIGKIDNYSTIKSGITDIPKISVNLYGINDGDSWEDLVKTNEPLQKIDLPKKEGQDILLKTKGFNNIMFWTEVKNMICLEPITQYPDIKTQNYSEKNRRISNGNEMFYVEIVPF